MQIRPDQLDRHLAKQLAPVYLIGGEEPLFVQESLDAVRAAARAAGCTERVVLEVESGFDWGRLGDVAVNLSLFGDRRLIELRLPTGKPGVPGAKAISAYCDSPSPDAVLLISAGSLDASQRKSAWVAAVERAGVFVYGWPLPLQQLPGWVERRLRHTGLAAPADAVALLAERSEGNLLAAAQEIEKLRLLFGEGSLTFDQVAAAVADSARYTIYDLAEAALEGQVGRSTRILRGLREEGVDPTLVLWSLARDLRVLAELAAGAPAGEVFARERVFKQRQVKLQRAARAAPAAAWQTLLVRAARADRVIKGIAAGRPWDELIQLAVSFAKASARQAAVR
jgi:DNA polymerase-3 subunit delta